MALHEPFGHLQHKLWSKERPGVKPGVKLAVWLPITKSRESTRSRCVQVECNTPSESSWGELEVCLRPHSNQRFELGVMSSQSLESPNQDSFRTPLWESQDKKAIWMQVPWRGVENTIWGKVVASPESGPWWVLWVQSCPWLVLAPRCSKMWTNHFVVGLMQVQVSE
jgi:hypothetical protein